VFSLPFDIIVVPRHESAFVSSSTSLAKAAVIGIFPCNGIAPRLWINYIHAGGEFAARVLGQDE
jgi:hypothetical protein